MGTPVTITISLPPPKNCEFLQHGVAGEGDSMLLSLRKGGGHTQSPRTQPDSLYRSRAPSLLPSFPLSVPHSLPGFPTDAEKTDLGLNLDLTISLGPGS